VKYHWAGGSACKGVWHDKEASSGKGKRKRNQIRMGGKSSVREKRTEGRKTNGRGEKRVKTRVLNDGGAKSRERKKKPSLETGGGGGLKGRMCCGGPREPHFPPATLARGERKPRTLRKYTRKVSLEKENGFFRKETRQNSSQKRPECATCQKRKRNKAKRNSKKSIHPPRTSGNKTGRIGGGVSRRLRSLKRSERKKFRDVGALVKVGHNPGPRFRLFS